MRFDDVGDPDEVLEDGPALGVAQVERDAPLVPVEGLEEERALALLERGHVPAYVAAHRRILDLDHVGSEIGELKRPPGPCSELLDGEDANVRERRCHPLALKPRHAFS